MISNHSFLTSDPWQQIWMLDITGYFLFFGPFSVNVWDGCGVLKIPVYQQFAKHSDYVHHIQSYFSPLSSHSDALNISKSSLRASLSGAAERTLPASKLERCTKRRASSIGAVSNTESLTGVDTTCPRGGGVDFTSPIAAGKRTLQVPTNSEI